MHTATYRTGRDRSPARGLAVPLAAGALVAVALGVYGRVHAPTGARSTSLLLWTVEFATSTGVLAFKSWFTTLVLMLGLFQLLTALRLHGAIPIPRSIPLWLGDLHRLSGTVTLLVALPVAYHCLWSLGFNSSDVRVLLHSIAGCFFFGLFLTKVLAVRRDDGPRWFIPVMGSCVLTAIVLVWATSALAYFTGRLGG